MTITKREFFDLWEGVKAQFYLDNNIILKSKHLDRLAYEINKVNPSNNGDVTETYLRNKIKVFDRIDSSVSISSSKYNALQNYCKKGVGPSKNKAKKKESKSISISTEEFPKHESIIDKMERMIKKDNESEEILEVHLTPNNNVEPVPEILITDSSRSLDEKIDHPQLPNTLESEETTHPEVPSGPKLETEDLKEDIQEDVSEASKSTDLELNKTEIFVETQQNKIEKEPEHQSKVVIEEPVLFEAELLSNVDVTIQDLTPLSKPDVVEVSPVSDDVKPIQKKGLLLVSLIALTFIVGFICNGFLASKISAEKVHPNYPDKTQTAENTIVTFFNLINQKDYKQAYVLTDNELWNPYSKFIKSDVWGGYENLSQPAMLRKNYTSKYGAERIHEVSFYAFDIIKQKNLFLKYDFHLARRDGKWIIIRMVYAK